MSERKKPRQARGPFDIPMPDHLAFRLEAIVKSLPRGDAFTLRRAPLATKAACVKDHEAMATGAALSPVIGPGNNLTMRSDISWISEESVDRSGDIVLANGMDDSLFGANPVVTLNHNYELAPVGLSVWRKRATESGFRGIKAKTVYPTRPGVFPAGLPWIPDQIFALVQTGLLAGKSIGFLPVAVRNPTAQETRDNPRLIDVNLIIEKWLLLEYACCAFPAQPHALVQNVQD